MPVVYRIHVKDHVDRNWSPWFEGMTITHEANGETAVRPVQDRRFVWPIGEGA
jgi:hypothetical protein